jgi:hypothetical protein
MRLNQEAVIQPKHFHRGPVVENLVDFDGGDLPSWDATPLIRSRLQLQLGGRASVLARISEQDIRFLAAVLQFW